MLAGESVTSDPGGRYQFHAAEAHPLPLQRRLPIMIGGSGEKKTLRTVAKHADLWNAMGTPEGLARKVDVLRGHCEAVGRDIGEIEFTLGVKLTIRDSAAEAERVWQTAMAHNRTPIADVEDDVTFLNVTPEQAVERIAPFVELGFRHIISEQPAPYDAETIERFIGEVAPALAKI
jgi:alkanesulfonate monooxygenase SsuD/methylene tetrahydromethanopterin reductase-like flavin-dependent oxidoreductase (luciferase family)